MLLATGLNNDRKAIMVVNCTMFLLIYYHILNRLVCNDVWSNSKSNNR